MSNGSTGVSSKKAHVEELFTSDQIKELRRCHSDPLYFIKNYVKIQHPVDGDILFTPRPYQERMIENFHKHRFNIAMLPRQVGKCLSTDTKIRVKVGTELMELEIGDFYEWCRFKQQYKNVLGL